MPRLTSRYITAYVIRGFFSVLGTLIYPLLSHSFPFSIEEGFVGFSVRIVATVLSSLVVAGSFAVYILPVMSRAVFTVSFALVGIISLGVSGFNPMTVFGVGLVFLVTTSWLWYSKSIERLWNNRMDFSPTVLEIRSACVAGIVVWIFHIGLGIIKKPDCLISFWVANLIIIGFISKTLRKDLSAVSRIPRLGTVFIVFLCIMAAVLTRNMPAVSVTWLTAISIFGLFSLRSVKQSPLNRSSSWLEDLFAEPYRLLFFSFLGICLIGGFVLSMPVSSASGTSVGVLNAVFTSVSATCVTGLVVLDTAIDFNFFGQIVIAALIQVGGLGIMTFSVAAILIMGKRLSLRYEGTMHVIIGDDGSLSTAIKRIIGITILAELIGAALLSWLFIIEGDAVGEAIFRGVFTSISAYCNAGFALQSDSLITYQHSPAILHVIAVLIIVGGLGPYVVASLVGRLWGRRFLLQPRIILITTLILLFVPAFFITILEWSNTLDSMSWWQKISNGWFQAVTPRTAGFNSIDIASMTPAGIAIIEGLMFVGGSPGSTAGGIKTTTLAIMILSVAAALRGRADVTVFGRQISQRSVVKATAVVVIAASAVFGILILLLLTQSMSFEVAIFEAMSALATVGLSIGGTSSLDEIGKIIIILAMFAGRLGPLTLFLLLSSNSGSDNWRLPEQEIHTG